MPDTTAAPPPHRAAQTSKRRGAEGRLRPSALRRRCAARARATLTLAAPSAALSEPDQLKPGFATAEGATLGPVSSALLWVFLGGLFALSLAFTSVPRDAATRFVPDDLAAEVAAQAN